jgi:hypothetical protein
MTPFGPWHVVLWVHVVCVGRCFARMRRVSAPRAICATAQVMLMTVADAAGLDPLQACHRGAPATVA